MLMLPHNLRTPPRRVLAGAEEGPQDPVHEPRISCNRAGRSNEMVMLRLEVAGTDQQDGLLLDGAGWLSCHHGHRDSPLPLASGAHTQVAHTKERPLLGREDIESMPLADR